MKLLPLVVFTLLSCMLSPVASAAADVKMPPVVWSLTEGIEAPESAYFDTKSGFVFLSQIGQGGGKADDGDGWISKLTPDGEMLENKWVTGLSAPKGIRVHDGTLWVSDITRLVAIDIATAKITRKIEIPDARFLNDVAAGPDGTIYVSDMVAGVVYAHHEGQTRVFAKGAAMEHPNGLLVHQGRLLLAGWGKNLKDDFSTDPVGRLLSIDLKSMKRRVITPKPLGNLDGLEVDGKGGYLVTDWRAGKVFHITGKGRATEILSLPQGTADHAYIVERRLLILPRMKDNTVSAHDLAPLFD
jgi:hypothetical protein